MNNKIINITKDEVIPPSPPVKPARSQRKSRLSSSSSKREREIVSLRSKNREHSNGHIQHVSPVTSSAESVDRPPIDIYAGLDNASTEEKQHIKSVLNKFDILAESKLLENCNQYDLSQVNAARSEFLSSSLAQTSAFISLKEFVEIQNGNEFESSVVNEARDISRENIQFSEWPLPNDCSLNASIRNECGETSQNRTDDPSIVESILRDFDDNVSSQEECTRSPPVILLRRIQRKTYERPQRSTQIKTLLFDDDNCIANREGNKPIDSDNDNCERAMQCTQSDNIDIDTDIDLNASRRIVENLTQLSSFFTKPQSYELDFNADLSHTIQDFEKRFDMPVSDDDDDEFQCGQKYISISEHDFNSPIETKANKSKTNIDFEMLDVDNDIFINIDTPKSVQQAKKLLKVDDFSVNNTTPSTSKQSTAVEQLVPKRLQFGAEMECNEATNSSIKPAKMCGGFATARGVAIETSDKAMKRAIGAFANVDNDYQHIDPLNSESPSVKRIKQSESTVTENRLAFDTNVTPMRPNSTKFGGFRPAHGNSAGLSATSMSKARNIFGDEDFSDLKSARPATGFKSSAVGPSFASTFGENFSDMKFNRIESKPSPVNFQRGFVTAAGASAKVSAKNLQRYQQMLNEVDRSVCEEFGASNKIEQIPTCKTPLAKFNHRSNAFATSTPLPRSLSDGTIPPITPINKKIFDVSTHENEFRSFIDNLNAKELEELKSSQSIDLFHHNDTSVRLNESITSGFHVLNESFAENATEVIKIDDDVKLLREKALNVQQSECFKKPRPIHPLPGWLMVHKMLDLKQLGELGRPKRLERNELERFGVDGKVIDVTVSNAIQFKFDMWKFYAMDVCQTNVDGIDLHDGMMLIMDANSRVGVKELTSAFLQCSSVDPNLIADHWINNALKWIIIKLASYECSFPHQFAGKSLTPENVLAQLKYRYDREIDKVQRSAIRRIVERDDSSAKRMILFVSRIMEHGLLYTLELCDGWYAIRTSSLDTILANAINQRKICVGTKLIIQGAELVGIEEGCSPLEMPSSVALKISANSTRRAKWDAKLGYCKESWPFAISLNSIYGNGGLITRTKVYVLRVYPLVFLAKEKTADGQKTVFRSNKVEQRHFKRNDKERFEIMEKVYSEAAETVEKEYEAKLKKYRSPRKKLCDIDDAEELWNFMEITNDGASMEMDLSATQRKLLCDYQTKLCDEKQNRVRTIVKEKMSAIENPSESTALQKIRLIDAVAPNAAKTAILSIFNVNESHSTIRENTFLDLRIVTTNGMRGKDVLLTATRSTIIREINTQTPSHAHDLYARTVTPISAIDSQQFKPHFSEFDTVGFVLKIDEVAQNQYQSVIVVDAKKNALCIKFWNGISQYAYEDIVKEKKFIAMRQLDWRAHSRLNINGLPQAFVTEITTFSENPKWSACTAALNALRDEFNRFDVTEFVAECLEKLQQNNKENSILNVSPKPMDSSTNQSHLSRTAPASSAAAVNKPTLGIQQKIDKLRYVGSPPAFRSSYIKNSNGSDLRKPFKNPTRKFD